VLPAQGSMTGGNTVTITGTGLAGTTSVTFGGTAATSFTVNSGTQITAVVPASLGGGEVKVGVTTPYGFVTGAYTYFAGPSIVSATPDAGPVAGGNAVVIAGDAFTDATAVTFGGTAATSFTVNSDTQITATAPAHAVGTVDIAVTTPSGTDTTAGGAYRYAALPNITGALSPNLGPIAGGLPAVDIPGTNLLGTISVTFDGIPGTDIFASDTDIIVTPPAHAAGTVDIVVTTPGGVVQANSGYTYIALPTITTVTPSPGPVAGGTLVTITGTNLNTTTLLEIDGVQTVFTAVDDTHITFTSPAHAAGAVNVAVTTAGGLATRVNGYTYSAAPFITSLSPDNGSTAGGTVVTITGSGFTGATAVGFAGTPATSFTVVSDTQITVTTPAHALSFSTVTVTTPAGSGFFSGFQFG
jgi:hypothetical protein